LEGVARDVARARAQARPDSPPLEAVLSWSKVWGGRAANRTQPHTLPSMNHWRVHPPQLPSTGAADYDEQLRIQMTYRQRRHRGAASGGRSTMAIRRPAPAGASGENR